MDMKRSFMESLSIEEAYRKMCEEAGTPPAATTPATEPKVTEPKGFEKPIVKVNQSMEKLMPPKEPLGNQRRQLTSFGMDKETAGAAADAIVRTAEYATKDAIQKLNPDITPEQLVAAHTASTNSPSAYHPYKLLGQGIIPDRKDLVIGAHGAMANYNNYARKHGLNQLTPDELRRLGGDTPIDRALKGYYFGEAVSEAYCGLRARLLSEAACSRMEEETETKAAGEPFRVGNRTYRKGADGRIYEMDPKDPTRGIPRSEQKVISNGAKDYLNSAEGQQMMSDRVKSGRETFRDIVGDQKAGRYGQIAARAIEHGSGLTPEQWASTTNSPEAHATFDALNAGRFPSTDTALGSATALMQGAYNATGSTNVAAQAGRSLVNTAQTQGMIEPETADLANAYVDNAASQLGQQ